jgi:hypothetical protein
MFFSISRLFLAALVDVLLRSFSFRPRCCGFLKPGRDIILSAFCSGLALPASAMFFSAELIRFLPQSLCILPLSCCFLPLALVAACCATVATSDCVLGHPFGLNIRSHPYANRWPPLSHLSLLSFFLLTADIIVFLPPSIVIRFLYFSVFRRCFFDRPPFCFLAPGSSRWHAPQHVSRLIQFFRFHCASFGYLP